MANIDKITLRGVNYPIIDSSVPAYVRGITQTDITNWNNKLDTFTETDPTVPSYVKTIKQTDITNWNSKTDNVGTITGITMNGSSKGTSGVVNLGTVITSETQLSKGTTSGSGNAVTDISVSNHQITLTKGKTFLESFTETDPIYSASAAAGITSSDITNWNNKLSEHQDLSSYVKWDDKESIESNTYTLSANRICLSSSSDRYIWGNGGIIFNDNGLRLEPNGNGLWISDNNDDTTQYHFRYDKRGDVAITKDITKAINSYVISASYISSSSLNTTLSSYATSANYDSSAKKIYLKHDTTVLSEIDATDFIKDGMVDTAYVQGSNLIISFNTDAGKSPVSIPVTDIFNASNYYTKTEINNAGYLTSFTETDPIYSASAAAGITSSDISNWNSKTDNVGTITGITMNGSSKGTSGVVNLGTVITSETQLSKGTTTGSGNAVTDISVSNHQITLTKGSTFLTSETDPIYSASAAAGITSGMITNWNSYANVKANWNETNSSSAAYIQNKPTIPTGLPAVTSSDNGKILQVVDGAWTLVTPLNLYSGSGTPNNAQGNNGDIYLQI